MTFISLPEALQHLIGNQAYEIDETGFSSSRILLYPDMVLKIEAQGEASENEIRMMRWLSNWLPVPQVLYTTTEKQYNYLLMSRIQGEMACTDYFLSQPLRLMQRLVQGLHQLWSIDIQACPSDQGLKHCLKAAEQRVLNNLCEIDFSASDIEFPLGVESPQQLLQWLIQNQPEQQLVVSHGDYCLPNIFTEGDRVTGLIDLGRSGIADQYQDIALCYRSLKHNLEGRYGGKVYAGFDAKQFFELLGIEPDWHKLQYYLLLDELF